MAEASSTIDLDYLTRIIHDKSPEDQHTEFKEAVPVSPEQYKVQAKAGELLNGRAFDKAVYAGSGIGDYGRNRLLEELVAFANADGGMIILGLSESDDSPPRAQASEPIPNVASLERRLRDQIIDQIEPRLASISTHTVAVGDNGSGILIIQTQASVLGPHWIRATRAATIRRGDKCVPLSMYEVHDMVLRNARRFDDVQKRLIEYRNGFNNTFKIEGNRMAEGFSGSSNFFGLEKWVAADPRRGILGIRTTIAPHRPLGLRRLESFTPISCNGSVDSIDSSGRKIAGLRLLLTDISHGRQVLGGVEYLRPGKEISIHLRAERDGLVNLKVVWLLSDQTVISAPWVLGVVGSAMGVFNKLRIWGKTADLPAEMGVEIRALGQVATQATGEWTSPSGEMLQRATHFDPITIQEELDFSSVLNEIAGDFANLIGLSSENLPHFILNTN